MSLSNNYIAVGVAHEADKISCVVLVTSSGLTLKLPEAQARKLADDLLRNANYLWPVEVEE